MSRSWLFLTAPVALVAIALLSRTVLSLVRAVRGSVITSVPIREEQLVTFDREGDAVLNIEGPMLASAGVGLRFVLSRGDSNGASVPMSPVLLRTEVSSMSRARLELYSFAIPSVGSYTLRIAGLSPGRDYGADTIVFTRPFRGALVIHVLSLILLGGIFVGSLVASGFALTGRSFAPAGSPASIMPDRNGSLEDAVTRSAAVVRAHTTIRGGMPRYQVVETFAGNVPSQIAGAGQPEGPMLDPRSTPSHYSPVDGQDVALLLAPVSTTNDAARPSVVLGQAIAILPIVDERVVYSPSATRRRPLTIAELRTLTRR